MMHAGTDDVVDHNTPSSSTDYGDDGRTASTAIPIDSDVPGGGTRGDHDEEQRPRRSDSDGDVGEDIGKSHDGGGGGGSIGRKNPEASTKTRHGHLAANASSCWSRVVSRRARELGTLDVRQLDEIVDLLGRDPHVSPTPPPPPSGGEDDDTGSTSTEIRVRYLTGLLERNFRIAFDSKLRMKLRSRSRDTVRRLLSAIDERYVVEEVPPPAKQNQRQQQRGQQQRQRKRQRGQQQQQKHGGRDNVADQSDRSSRQRRQEQQHQHHRQWHGGVGASDNSCAMRKSCGPDDVTAALSSSSSPRAEVTSAVKPAPRGTAVRRGVVGDRSGTKHAPLAVDDPSNGDPGVVEAEAPALTEEKPVSPAGSVEAKSDNRRQNQNGQHHERKDKKEIASAAPGAGKVAGRSNLSAEKGPVSTQRARTIPTAVLGGVNGAVVGSEMAPSPRQPRDHRPLVGAIVGNDGGTTSTWRPSSSYLTRSAHPPSEAAADRSPGEGEGSETPPSFVTALFASSAATSPWGTGDYANRGSGDGRSDSVSDDDPSIVEKEIADTYCDTEMRSRDNVETNQKSYFDKADEETALVACDVDSARDREKEEEDQGGVVMEEEEDLIATINPNDVVCGRDDHDGNVKFHGIITSLKPMYLALTTKLAKVAIAVEVVSRVRNQDPPGRFLESDEVGSGKWVDIGDERAVKKAEQALRNGDDDINAKERKAGSQGRASDVPKVADANVVEWQQVSEHYAESDENSPHIKEKELGGITTANPNDVVCGLGDMIIHTGRNVNFYDIVTALNPNYSCLASMSTRVGIAAEVVTQIRNQDPPGRFLCLDFGSSKWAEIGDARARKAVERALAKMAPIAAKQKNATALAAKEVGGSVVMAGEGRLIDTPNHNDVVCGCGDIIMKDKWNAKFHYIVTAGLKQTSTQLASISTRVAIAAEVVTHIRNQDPPGRFLCLDSASCRWADIGDERARKAVEQALAEMTPATEEQRKATPWANKEVREGLVRAGIDAPNANDVVCGDGDMIMRSEWNAKIRDFITTVRHTYSHFVSTSEKVEVVANVVVTKIRSLDPPGRFLREDTISCKWFDIGDQRAVKSVEQALTEMTPVAEEQTNASTSATAASTVAAACELVPWKAQQRHDGSLGVHRVPDPPLPPRGGPQDVIGNHMVPNLGAPNSNGHGPCSGTPPSHSPRCGQGGAQQMGTYPPNIQQPPHLSMAPPTECERVLPPGEQCQQFGYPSAVYDSCRCMQQEQPYQLHTGNASGASISNFGVGAPLSPLMAATFCPPSEPNTSIAWDFDGAAQRVAMATAASADNPSGQVGATGSAWRKPLSVAMLEQMTREAETGAALKGTEKENSGSAIDMAGGENRPQVEDGVGGTQRGTPKEALASSSASSVQHRHPTTWDDRDCTNGGKRAVDHDSNSSVTPSGSYPPFTARDVSSQQLSQCAMADFDDDRPLTRPSHPPQSKRWEWSVATLEQLSRETERGAALEGTVKEKSGSAIDVKVGANGLQVGALPASSDEGGLPPRQLCEAERSTDEQCPVDTGGVAGRTGGGRPQPALHDMVRRGDDEDRGGGVTVAMGLDCRCPPKSESSDGKTTRTTIEKVNQLRDQKAENHARKDVMTSHRGVGCAEDGCSALPGEGSSPCWKESMPAPQQRGGKLAVSGLGVDDRKEGIMLRSSLNEGKAEIPNLGIEDDEVVSIGKRQRGKNRCPSASSHVLGVVSSEAITLRSVEETLNGCVIDVGPNCRRLAQRSVRTSLKTRNREGLGASSTPASEQNGSGSDRGRVPKTAASPPPRPLRDSSSPKDSTDPRITATSASISNVPSPSCAVLTWHRQLLTSIEQRSNVRVGHRIKVNFGHDGWYGGRVARTMNNGNTLHIVYDDGSQEVSSFPDSDIVVDDVGNGIHANGINAGTFVPPPLKSRAKGGRKRRAKRSCASDNDDHGFDDCRGDICEILPRVRKRPDFFLNEDEHLSSRAVNKRLR